ncbi:MAG: alkaline phosphatase D family protein [Burkholderiaceae bacterium]
MSTNHAVLMLASCQYPPDLLREIPAYRSLARMHTRLRAIAEERPDAQRVLWMAGDTIYVDPTAGLFDPEHPYDRYDAPYRFLKGRVWRDVVEAVDHVFCMADDHEYEENWEPAGRHAVNRHLRRALFYGKRAHMQNMRAGLVRISPRDVFRCPLWGPIESVAGMGAFALDLRSERERRDIHNIERARMCSPGQMAAFRGWLDSCLVRDRRAGRVLPKLVLSASTLLPRRLLVADGGSTASALQSDACDGYPAFLAELFDTIVRKQVPGLLFVSGDEHLSFVTRAELRAAGLAPVIIHSVHASPLYGPYPFANGVAEAFVEDDEFITIPLAGTGPVQVVARTRFMNTGNGFCELGFGGYANAGIVEASFCGETRMVTESLRLPG